MRNVLTVNYNTQELTEAMIRSLNKHTEERCRVYVFDNSDREKFVNRFGNVEVIDNTERKIIDLEEWLSSFPNKYPNPSNDYGSAKHCKSVDVCFELIGEPFLLMDSDVLVKKDVGVFFDGECAACGEIIEDRHYISVPRLAPFVCYIDAVKCMERGVRYFNANYMWKLNKKLPNRFFDTGAWFLLALRKKDMPIKQLPIFDYVQHFGNGSWRGVNSKEFLTKNRELWQV